VRDHQRQIEELGATVLAISFGTPEDVEEYARYLALPFAVASDVTLAAYAAYGLNRGARSAVYGPGAILQHIALGTKGVRAPPGAPKQDTLRLGGDFVVDRTGVIAFAHRSTSGDDRASIDDVLRAVRADTTPRRTS
jgi:hypothetical protein